MKTRIRWPELHRSARLKGHWVALENCRYDQDTLQPIEGDVVDADENLSELCDRIRDAGHGACTLYFCDHEPVIAAPSDRVTA